MVFDGRCRSNRDSGKADESDYFAAYGEGSRQHAEEHTQADETGAGKV